MENLLIVLLVIAISIVCIIIYSQLPIKKKNIYTGNLRWYISSMDDSGQEVLSKFFLTEEEARAEFEAMKETEYDMHLYSAVVCFDNGKAEIQDDEVIDAYWDEEKSN